MSDRKIVYTGAVIGVADQLAEIHDKVKGLYKAYFDNGFNEGGSNPITTQDIESQTQIGADDVGNMINFFQQLLNFLGNSVVTQGDWAVNLNKVRSKF